MMGKVISIVNRKGGVGKTTTAVALADTFVSEFRESVVVVDLDPQASASIALAGEDEFLKRTKARQNLSGLLDRLIEEPSADPTPYIVGQVNCIRGRADVALAVVPNSEELWNLEYERAERGEMHLLQGSLTSLLTCLREQYSYVIVDSPPGQSYTSQTALIQSDIVVCPTVPDRISEWGLDRFSDYVRNIVDLAEKPVFFIVTRYEKRPTEHQEVIGRLRNRPRGRISLLLSDVAGPTPDPLLIGESKRFLRRLGVKKPTTHKRLYGDGADQLIQVARAIKRELGEDA